MTTEQKAVEALLLVHQFWLKLAERVMQLEDTRLQSVEQQHAVLVELVKEGIREHQLIESNIIQTNFNMSGGELLRLLNLAAAADPEKKQ